MNLFALTLTWLPSVFESYSWHMAGYFILAVLAAILLEIIVLRYLIDMLKSSQALVYNYLGHLIPVGLGLSFPIIIIAVYFGYGLAGMYADNYHYFLIGVVTMSFLGFIDDILGQRDKLGLKGHLGALRRGQLTTGGLKAVGGIGLAVLVAWFIGGNGWNILFNAIIMALFANAVNLLDLRPGRAIKGYLFFLLIIIAAAGGKVDWLLFAPLLGAVLVYWVLDIKALAMMGDTGSNVLGFSLGFMTVVSLGFYWRLGFLIFLVLLHIFTERYSISQVIERVGFLRAIDNWGRSKPDDQPAEIDR